MKKVIITVASLLAIVGIILLNALTFSSRYARMMETTITVKSADSTFMGKEMKAFFQREDLEEKLAAQLEDLALFPGHPSWNKELAHLIVSTGQDVSLEEIRLQGRRYYGGFRIHFHLAPEDARTWEERYRETFTNDHIDYLTAHPSSHIRLKKYSGWDSKTADDGSPYGMGSAEFLLTQGGVTQLVYITVLTEPKDDGLMVTLFLSDHNQGTKGIPFYDMAEAE
ncbi:hypothetical protein [uncultured Dialister sp.]|uniref:hypothetical protein n=1 Tax=uncultured Dialister sp. TaxID=278064 RepID=UPI0025E6AF9B|nr:hypothetical protein [uncultured Dialister sp.]